MSSPDLAEQLDHLAADLAAVTSELRQLSIRVSALENHQSSTAATSEFELVGSAAGSENVVTGFSAERIRISRGIGQWLRRCLRGDSRGPSGRDQIPLQSKYYLVARDINLVNHNPPLIFHSWTEAKPHCAVSGTSRSPSIYVGLPALQDIKLVVEAAGLIEPVVRRQ